MSYSWVELAQAFAVDHLPSLCAEIVDWKKTGLLNGGNGGLLREMAERMPVSFGEAERIAESIVTDLALARIAKEAVR